MYTEILAVYALQTVTQNCMDSNCM